MANWVEIKNGRNCLIVSFNCYDCEKCVIECGRVSISGNCCDNKYYDVECYDADSDRLIAILQVENIEDIMVRNDVETGTYHGDPTYFSPSYAHTLYERHKRGRTEITKMEAGSGTPYLMVQSDCGEIDCSKIYVVEARDELWLYYYSPKSGEYIGESKVKKDDLYYDKKDVHEYIDEQNRKYLSASVPPDSPISW